MDLVQNLSSFTLDRLMKLPRDFYLTVSVLLVLTALGLLPISLYADQAPTDNSAKPKSEEQKASLIEIYSWANILPKELIDLQNTLKKDSGIQAVDDELSGLTRKTTELNNEVNRADAASQLQLNEVTNYQEMVYKLTNRLKKLSDPITAIISDLSQKRSKWKARKVQISQYDKNDVLSLNLAEEQHKILTDTVDSALNLIDEQLKQALVVGKRIGDLQIILYSTSASLQAMEDKLRQMSIQQTSPSMFSSKFYARINLQLFRQSYANTRQFLMDQLQSLQKNRNAALVVLIVFLLCCLAVYETRRKVPPSSRWYPFAAYPIATTVFIASSLNAFVGIMPVNYDLPQRWEALLRIMVLIAAIRLSADLIVKQSWRRLLRRLLVFMITTVAMIVINIPSILISLYVFYISVIALIYYFYQLPGTKGRTDTIAWVRRYFGIFPAAVLLLGISGYDQFAMYLFSTLLSAIIACLIIWMLYRLHFGLLDLLLILLPANLIGDHREIILKSLQPIIVCFHLLLLAAIQGVIWSVFPNLNEAFTGIFNFGFDIFSLHISPGFVFTIIFIIYWALLVSKATQMLLLDRILPSYGAEKGVQLSITRLAHYAILSIGFLIMLRVLGFQLHQLALVGGALGVGIGFGLQAIVSNFVCGLILLFERPIKVGDTITVGTDVGEVKNLGLRATIIQTFDNAEIVVPNADLVTGQVTNWTLAERKVRVRVPVGVAYGTDISQVLDILQGCAEANPVVLSTPKPKAFFLAFGSSSLDFELRVWISEYLDKVQVLSDLNQDIENEFSIHKIEIPFPQTDLHLRTVDEAAAARMRCEPRAAEEAAEPQAPPGDGV